MTVIGFALLLGVLASALVLAYVLYRSCLPDPKMRLLSDLMGHSHVNRPKHRHVHA